MKDELGGKIVTGLVGLRPKTYSCLVENGENKKKTKVTKKCVIKRRPKSNDYKNCLLKNEIILKSQQIFKSEGHNVHTNVVNKITLSNNDDKRVWPSDEITSYPYSYTGKHAKQN